MKTVQNEWADTLRLQRAQLELVASWASQVNLGHVRDHIRLAISALEREEIRVRSFDEQRETP